MLLVKDNSNSLVKIYKEAPCVEDPYIEKVNKSTPFYENDPESSKVIAGYCMGPKKSYAKELAEKYPLTGK